MMINIALISMILSLGLVISPALAQADPLKEAIQAYRQGQYMHAQQLLNQPTTKPSARWLYYQALTATQLGQTALAEQTYRQLLERYPDTPESQLGEEALKLLGDQLDPPPGLTVATPTSGVGANTTASSSAATSNWMQMMMPLMLMGSGGGNQSDGMMNMMLMNQMMGPKPGESGSTNNGLDASALSNMMMSQFMNQMDFGGHGNDR